MQIERLKSRRECIQLCHVSMLTLVFLQLPSLSISKSFLNTISPKYLWNIKYYYPPYIITLQTRNQDWGAGVGMGFLEDLRTPYLLQNGRLSSETHKGYRWCKTTHNAIMIMSYQSRHFFWKPHQPRCYFRQATLAFYHIPHLCNIHWKFCEGLELPNVQ